MSPLPSPCDLLFPCSLISVCLFSEFVLLLYMSPLPSLCSLVSVCLSSMNVRSRFSVESFPRIVSSPCDLSPGVPFSCVLSPCIPSPCIFFLRILSPCVPSLCFPVPSPCVLSPYVTSPCVFLYDLLYVITLPCVPSLCARFPMSLLQYPFSDIFFPCVLSPVSVFQCPFSHFPFPMSFFQCLFSICPFCVPLCVFYCASPPCVSLCVPLHVSLCMSTRCVSSCVRPFSVYVIRFPTCFFLWVINNQKALDSMGSLDCLIQGTRRYSVRRLHPQGSNSTETLRPQKVNYKSPKNASKHQKMCSSDIFLALLAFLFPPIAGSSSFILRSCPLLIEKPSPVWIKRGLCSADSFINIALCILGYLPGLLHAWYIISSYPESDYEEIPNDGGEGGRVTYYYVNRREQEHPSLQQTGSKPAPKGYGTTHGMNSAPAPVPEEGSSAGGDQGVPPSYEQAIKGDHKVQT